LKGKNKGEGERCDGLAESVKWEEWCVSPQRETGGGRRGKGREQNPNSVMWQWKTASVKGEKKDSCFMSRLSSSTAAK